MTFEASLQPSGVSSSLTQADIILPSQHFRPRRKIAPEHRLMIAVLHDALECFTKSRSAEDNRGKRRFRETAQWFQSRDTAWPYAFECICEVLDLDADAVRQRLGIAI
jgi:hypothetical protein